MPTTMLNVVVLPAPLGPSKPTISPGLTKIETPSTTARLLYFLTSWEVERSDVSAATGAAARSFCNSGFGSAIVL